MKGKKSTLTKGTLVALLVAVLLLGSVVGGTIAWLTDTTDPVQNTFTTSDVDIELTEAAGGEDKEFKMVPGCTIAKDPKVTVKAGSEKCWLFVKLEKSENLDAFMTYAIADGWTELTVGSGIYYREVNADGSDQNFDILENNKVQVKDTVTKGDMTSLTEADTYPTLTFTAYACQFAKGDENFTAAEAWAQVGS